MQLTLTEEQIRSIIEAADQGTAPKAAIEMLVEETKRTLAAGDAELERLQNSDEKSAEFNDPMTITDDNPQGTFSPMSTANRNRAISNAQGVRDTAFLRHEWAKKQI